MKGILKGALFSVVLITIFICIAAAIAMTVNIPDNIFKGVLWVLLGVCIFLGCLLVSKSGNSKKALRGLACALVTILIMFVIVSIAGKQIPHSGNFYAFALICMLCGFLGSLAGAKS